LSFKTEKQPMSTTPFSNVIVRYLLSG